MCPGKEVSINILIDSLLLPPPFSWWKNEAPFLWWKNEAPFTTFFSRMELCLRDSSERRSLRATHNVLNKSTRQSFLHPHSFLILRLLVPWKSSLKDLHLIRTLNKKVRHKKSSNVKYSKARTESMKRMQDKRLSRKERKVKNNRNHLENTWRRNCNCSKVWTKVVHRLWRVWIDFCHEMGHNKRTHRLFSWLFFPLR